ncbi:MAG: C25 family cysteine peptidase [Promethearchaeota archaeon]
MAPQERDIMKRSFTKWCGIPLIALLTFSLIYPLLYSPLLLPSNKALVSASNVHRRTFEPVIPQPASPEYLIITPNSNWVQSFAEWKTLKGVSTQVINVSWIQATYPLSSTIRDKAEQIWTAIKSIYDATTPATLQWVLLIGDNATIPSRYVYLPDTTEWTGQDPNRKPTDFYYSVMGDTDWDDDGDGRWGECATFNVGGPSSDEIGDWISDLYVGRIPFSDQGNVTSILTKAVDYARNPTSFSATGWDTFLLGGAISNYDEEVWAWLDQDYTDEAELSDYINANHIPGYYDIYRFYENRFNFWNYTSPNTFQDLNDTAVIQGINRYSPALINLAAHGSPTDIQRKYDPWGFPYGNTWSSATAGWNNPVTGVAIGDPDNDGFNELVYTHGMGTGAFAQNGTIWLRDPSTMVDTLIWDLWTFPVDGFPTYATCVDIGDVWNNGTIAVVVGTWSGSTVIFTRIVPLVGLPYWRPVVVNGPEPSDPVLCIEVGNADNVLEPHGYGGSGTPSVNIDIVWGHRSGLTFIASCVGAPGPVGHVVRVALVWNHGQAVYSIDVGDPDDDTMGEITCGTGFTNASGDFGNVYRLFYLPAVNWFRTTIDKDLGGFVYGCDSGDAGNDFYNKVVVGVSDGSIYMYEAGCLALGYGGYQGGTDVGTRKTISSPGGNAGMVRCLNIGFVDDNDLLTTYPTPVEHYSIIAGNQYGGIWKYHANNVSGFIDAYPIAVQSFTFGVNVTDLDVGELSYVTGETTFNQEVAAGSEVGMMPLSFVYWFEWPWNLWGNMLNTTQVNATTATIPALIYADSCHTAGYEYTQECLAEAFIRNMAIGYIGSMRICWYYRGTMTQSFLWGLGRYMSQEFWDLFFSGTTAYRPGATLYQNKIDYQSTFASIASSFPTTWETYHRKNLLSYALFGDPEIDVFTNNPRTLTISAPANANYQGTTVLQALDGTSPVANATICLWDKDGTYYEVQTTNASGHAVFTVTASVPNSLNITATAHNYIPHQSTIGVAHWLDISQPTISYIASTASLDVTGIIATCSNLSHGSLDDTEATTHTYTIYTNGTDTATAITATLTWTGTSWQALGIDISSLAIGSYYVRCTFADADVTNTMSPASAIFTIAPVGPPPFDWLLWLMQNWLIILIIIVLLIVILLLVFRMRRRGEAT